MTEEFLIIFTNFATFVALGNIFGAFFLIWLYSKIKLRDEKTAFVAFKRSIAGLEGDFAIKKARLQDKIDQLESENRVFRTRIQFLELENHNLTSKMNSWTPG